MSIVTHLPIKFECTPCDSIYMHQYSNQLLSFYPTCPHCKQAGSLLGTIEAIDVIKYPQIFAKTLFKQIKHKLNT